MKNLLIICVVVLVSCKTSKPVNSVITASETIFVQSENCPENGNCVLELIPNKTITFKKDEFGNLYPVISEGSKTLFKYTFTKNPISETEDSNYTEIVYAELNLNEDLKLQNEALKNIKMHYGRLCFCKGESGYFPIERGVFNLTKMEGDLVKIDVDFIMKKIPQLVSEIHETVSLKSNTTN
ncbi:hypothetical protein SAMN06265371_10298 [Lutibacter agarilyticus]|uniref:Uncharacterized protein n=1 Tax=Lutibacter agarilyticus TaxID=1109740 RepID=A0A238VWG9_9FLAO|nr:hypothetical protein [Lutibacter agarilyticus]SNR37829.1 hypothetical protein SAMN06265371_10298 [Lutibacter agarilyticus]